MHSRTSAESESRRFEPFAAAACLGIVPNARFLTVAPNSLPLNLVRTNALTCCFLSLDCSPSRMQRRKSQLESQE